VEDEAELVVASLPDAPVKSSEESPQAKLSRFSKNISSLKNNLKNTNSNPEALLAKLGGCLPGSPAFHEFANGY
jgi:hypothetical protein